MILINGVEIKTIEDNFTFSGAKDIVTRSLDFNFIYNPLRKDIPKYNVAINDKVEFIEDGKTIFLGYVENLNYSTDSDLISVNCLDNLARVVRSKCIGRFRGTLTELANKICASFNIKNGINSDSTKVHNIVSTGDLTYYEVLKTACDALFGRYALYMDGDTLRLSSQAIQATFETGLNIRSSNFSQSMSDMVTKVIMIDNDGNIKGSVQNDADLKKFGLFQEVYNYNTDIKNNQEEAKKLLKSVDNQATIVTNNINYCTSGKYIAVNEPVNGLNGVFEIISDNHVVGSDSVMTLEIEYVYGIQNGKFIETESKIQEEIKKTPEGTKNENVNISIDEYLEQKQKEIERAKAEMIKKMEAEGYVLVNGEWRKLN